jgi:carbamoyl-phosphate synthase small subunit
VQTITTVQTSEAPATTRPVPRSVDGLLALEGGAVHRGILRGHPGPAAGDLIFTTAATGWGEILTDPSYAGQIVVLTHPMAGNYRIAEADFESTRVHARALICSRLVTPPAGPGRSLEELLAEAEIPALTGVDTRALTLELRRGSARRAVIRLGSSSDAEAVAEATTVTPWAAVDHVASVATRVPYVVAPQGQRLATVVLIDYGVKRSLLAALAGRGLEIRVLPPDASAADVASGTPDLVVLSPGPGDPSRMAPQIDVVAELARRAIDSGPPVLGICLGHQLLALAAGAGTRRLAVGHHGGNHAVLDIDAGRVDIGAHNHEVEVVDGPALAAAGYTVSHRDLNDGTVEGLRHASGRIASVQFHPEGAPGPIDAARVFDLAVGAALA